MTKIERLQLENDVLRRIIARVQEKLDNLDENPYETIGRISAVIEQVDEDVEYATRRCLWQRK